MASLVVHFLLHFKDKEIILECFWALAFFLENNQITSSIKPKIILEWGVFHIFIEQLQSEKTLILRPLLRIIGYFSFGNREEINSVFTSECVNHLEKLLKHDTLMIKFDSCWIISNVVLGNPEAYEMFYRPSLFITLGEIIVLDKDERVVNEALNAIYSFVHDATPAIAIDLVRNIKLVIYLMESLIRREESVIANALRCIDMLLTKVESCRNFGQENIVAHEIRHSDNFRTFEHLLEHSNREIYELVGEMMNRDFMNQMGD